MAKQVTQRITRFDGGVSDSTRMGTANGAGMVAHFDIFKDPKKLTPFRSMTPNEDTTFKIVKFLFNGTKLYGYGVKVGGAIAKIYEKSSDPITDSWTASTTGEDAGGGRDTNCFVYFGATIYGFTANSRIWSYNTSTNTFTATAVSVSYTNTAQGLVGKKDGKLYLPYDNFIASYDGTTWNATAYTAPTGTTITSIEEYGNYIAVALRPTATFTDKSVVHIWDRAKPTTPDEIVDFGNEILKIISNVDGVLVGVSSSSLTSGSSFTITNKIVFRQWSIGDKAVVFKEVLGQDSSSLLESGSGAGLKQQVGNSLYFAMKVKLNGASRYGVWALSRKTNKYEYGLSLACLPDNDTVVTAIDGFFIIGDYIFVAHNSDGSVNRTNDQSTYTATSYWESEIFDGNSSLPKDLLEARLEYDPLPTAGQVVLTYRKNADTSWATLFTETDDNGFLTTKDTQIGQWNQLQFRIESTGGAEITALQFTYEYGD